MNIASRTLEHAWILFFLLLRLSFFLFPIIFFSTFADNCRSHISSRRCYRHGGQVRDILFCSFYCWINHTYLYYAWYSNLVHSSHTMSPWYNHNDWLGIKHQLAIQYNITLLPSVNTLIARGMFCGAKYAHHTFTPIIKHLIITTANKLPGKKSFRDKNLRRSHWHQAVHITWNKIATSRGPPLESYCPNKSNYKNYLQQII